MKNQKPILVTGGTGFLGEHVVRDLLRRDLPVRVLSRSRSPILDALGVEQVRGDVLVKSAVEAAVQGVDSVLHLAGLVSRDPLDKRRMMEVHVEGTRNVLNACHAAGVKRIVVSSSSGTIAVSKDPVVHTEESPHPVAILGKWPYYVSKMYQESLALDVAKRLGLEVVLVNPSLLLGPGDRRMSSTKDVWRLLKKQVPFVPPGGVNFVDVRDAATATVNARFHGKPGERYLLGGPNWTCQEFFARVGRAANMGWPRLKAPSILAKWGARAAESMAHKLGREPWVDVMSVEMGEHFWYIDSSKAERELEFFQREPTLTLVDTVKYLRQGLDSEFTVNGEMEFSA